MECHISKSIIEMDCHIHRISKTHQVIQSIMICHQSHLLFLSVENVICEWRWIVDDVWSFSNWFLYLYAVDECVIVSFANTWISILPHQFTFFNILLVWYFSFVFNEFILNWKCLKIWIDRIWKTLAVWHFQNIILLICY